MADPLTMMTAAVCMAICVRIVAFRRAGYRYRVGVSVLAYALAASTGCEALAALLGLYPANSPFMLLILLVLCALVFRAQGNVARIVRIDWPARWHGSERRGHK